MYYLTPQIIEHKKYYDIIMALETQFLAWDTPTA